MGVNPAKWLQPRMPVWVREEEIPRKPKRTYPKVIVPFLAQLKTRPMEWAIYSFSRRDAMTRSQLPHTDAMYVEIKNRLFFYCPKCEEEVPWHPKGCLTCKTISPRDMAKWRVFMRWCGDFVPLEEEDW